LRKQNKRVYNKTKNKQKKLKSILLIFVVITIVYVMYTIIDLVIKPVDAVLVEEGKIYSEETTVGYILRDEIVISRWKL